MIFAPVNLKRSRSARVCRFDGLLLIAQFTLALFPPGDTARAPPDAPDDQLSLAVMPAKAGIHQPRCDFKFPLARG
jgi:hypothetical protein